MIHTVFPKSFYLKDDLITNFETKKNNMREVILQRGDEWGWAHSDTLNAPSLHKTNPSLHTVPEFKELCDAIIKHAEIYSVKMGYNLKLKLTSMWANLSQEGHYVYPHTHPGSIFSGAYYITAPPSSTITFESGDKFFFTPSSNNPLTSNEIYLECKPNRLIIFRSDFSHYTTKQLPGEKLVISFNLLPV